MNDINNLPINLDLYSSSALSKIKTSCLVTLEMINSTSIKNNNIPKPKQEVSPIPTDAYMMVEYVDLSASAGALG